MWPWKKGKRMKTTESTASCVRWMTARDLPQVVEVVRKQPDCRRCTPKTLAGFSDSRNHVSKVAATGSLITGVILYVVRQDSLVIEDLCVREGQRRQGIGSELIGEAKETAHKLGRETITIIVDEANVDAQLFLKNLGFQWTQTITSPSNRYTGARANSATSEHDHYLMQYTCKENFNDGLVV